MKIIGLTGYAQTGKDTVGAMLTDKGWHRIGFADNVRALALAADPLVPDGLGAMFWTQRDNLSVTVCRLSELVERQGWEAAKRNPEVRRTLQAIGSGVRNVIGETTWIDAALPFPGSIYLDGNGRPYPGVVVTDVRHPNEAAAIRGHGGIIVRVNRPGVGPANDHITEVGVDRISVDALITNDGTVEELEEKVAGLLSTLEAMRSAV